MLSYLYRMVNMHPLLQVHRSHVRPAPLPLTCSGTPPWSPAPPRRSCSAAARCKSRHSDASSGAAVVAAAHRLGRSESATRPLATSTPVTRAITV